MVLILGAIDSRNACYALHCRHPTAEPSDVQFRRQQSQVTKLNGCNQPAFSARCGDPSQRLFLMRQFMRHLGGSCVPLTSHLEKNLKNFLKGTL